MKQVIKGFQMRSGIKSRKAFQWKEAALHARNCREVSCLTAEQRSAGKDCRLRGNPCGQSHSGMEGEPWERRTQRRTALCAAERSKVKDKVKCAESCELSILTGTAPGQLDLYPGRSEDGNLRHEVFEQWWQRKGRSQEKEIGRQSNFAFSLITLKEIALHSVIARVVSSHCKLHSK